MHFNMNSGKGKGRGVRLVAPCLGRLVAGCLLLGLAACGAPVSEKAPGQAPSAGKGEITGGAVATREMQHGSDQNDRKGVSSGQSGTDLDERDNQSIAGVPDMVVKELSSPDPRDRYRALDHWEKKDNNASLDPVFEAMEDEDEAVRAKATAIVEQRWAEKRERKQG